MPASDTGLVQVWVAALCQLGHWHLRNAVAMPGTLPGGPLDMVTDPALSWCMQIGFENAGGSSTSFCLDNIVLSNGAASS